MPSVYSHAIMGEHVAQKLKTSAYTFLQSYKQCFLLGCQGPDPFMYEHLLSAPVRRKSALNAILHQTRVEETMRAMLEYAQKRPDCLAYFMGYLCHYTLDCAAHPYVKHRTNRTGHIRYENGMDIRLIVHYNSNIQTNPPEQYLEISNFELEQIDLMFETVFREVFGIRAGGKFKKSLSEMRKWMNICYDPDGRRRKRIARFERVFGKEGILSGMLFTERPEDVDYLNESRCQWCAPWKPEEKRNATYLEIMDEAEKEAVELCEAVWDAVRIGVLEPALEKIGGLSFLTGMPWRDDAPLICTENVFERKTRGN